MLHARDAPHHRIWPPLAFGIPWLGGAALTWWVGDPFPVGPAARVAGLALLGLALAWNAWTFFLMVRHRTGILPDQATSVLLTQGPFAVSRNPLYLGLVALHVGAAFAWPSVYALLALPLGILVVTWGAIRPEESYLHRKFGPAYEAYAGRVRRWL